MRAVLDLDNKVVLRVSRKTAARLAEALKDHADKFAPMGTSDALMLKLARSLNKAVGKCGVLP